MRAARVLDMLLTLQRRGRMTAGRLAREFEVSERTILRDVEALGEAGVPIYTVRGIGGGIELMDGFETRLTGLTEEEARAMLLAGRPEIATRLGMGRAAATARRKLREALSPSLRPLADGLDEWFLHDPDPWHGHRIPAGELRRIAACIQQRRVMEMTLGDAALIEARPLGLVLKGGSWFVVDHADPTGVIAIDDLVATRITRRTFGPPAGFSLSEFWAVYASTDSGEGPGADR